MIEELASLPDGGECLAPDVLHASQCMPAEDNTTAAEPTAAAQREGQPAEVFKAPGASTSAGTLQPALEQTTVPEHDELQDLLQ